MFRKTIFWLHLGTGVVVGLVVAMMSFTGVLLTYERQLIEWADSKEWPEHQAGAERLSIEEIAASAAEAGVNARRITFYRNEQQPLLAGGGRRDPSTRIDAFTGDDLGRAHNGTRELMETLTGWHRWFNATGESRETAILITGGSNLAFLFLIVSGAYLWLPKMMRWPMLRTRLLFMSYRTSKLRDFYWHHIFAAWSIIPLIVIVATAVVISFPWANGLLTGMAGDSPGREIEPSLETVAASTAQRNLDELLQTAMAQSDDWNALTINMPEPGARTVSFELDEGSGRQPHKRHTVMLDTLTGKVVGASDFADRPPATRAISWNRYLHTGESFGVVGQTIAGLVSIASLLMVWTGFALAWRRLIVPLYRKS
jgi:uncharacterized iron-regulated membrane protein